MDRSFLNLFSLQGKEALIVGGGGHLCSAMAIGLASAGARVHVADLRLEKAQKVSDSINEIYLNSALPVQLDATNKLDFEKSIENTTHGFFDVLINGAGINSPTPFLELSLDEWNSVLNSQINATFIGCQAIAPGMLRNHKGSIINISSASADPALSKAFPYSVAKAGIRNLTQNLGREWATSGVRVNAVRPGFFPTEWNLKNFITPEREAAILNHTPMSRFGTPDELIGAVIYLASDASSFVTGSELVVDGGFSAMTI
ncbi:MAG: hypothetical protein RL193_9 [Actinomycetota bacterium]|jgi:NAD(P)-dependent dehydrogenase (short-subunit alcohol dehydrogenase family)